MLCYTFLDRTYEANPRHHTFPNSRSDPTCSLRSCTAAANTNRQARHHKWLDLGKTPIGTKVAYEHPTRPEWLWRIIIGLKTQGDTAVALAKLMA